MESPPIRVPRALGTMVAYGFDRGSVSTDLDIARDIGATCLEILPDWASFPDPSEIRRIGSDRGFTIHSAHGCWGGQSIHAPRVDLGSIDDVTRSNSVDDLRRCLDWLAAAGGRHLVVHPGGYSDPEEADRRRDSLIDSLGALADHANGTGIVLCVENMPPGVFPGSRMADLAAIVAEINRPGVGLVVDTGHAHIVDSSWAETLAACRWLRSTHVHDNDGRKDNHLPPGSGTTDWMKWADALDEIGYFGPIMLECIRLLRTKREGWNLDVLSPALGKPSQE